MKQVSNVIIRRVLCFTAFCARIHRAGRKLGSLKLSCDGLEYPLWIALVALHLFYYFTYYIIINSIWWHKNITKNRKLCIYQTIIQSILVYGAEVWQIPTREINKILSTEMDVLRRSARKSRMERIKNEHIKEIMGVKGKPDIIDTIEKKRLQWYGHVKRM